MDCQLKQQQYKKVKTWPVIEPGQGFHIMEAAQKEFANIFGDDSHAGFSSASKLDGRVANASDRLASLSGSKES